MEIKITKIQPEDHTFFSEITHNLWGSETIIAHGEIFHTTELDGIKAIIDDEIVGFLHYKCLNKAFEIITLASLKEGYGVGSALINSVEGIARENGSHVFSVITTNDNLYALGFYQRRGFHLSEIFPGSVNESRKIKPSIPEIGENHIPIRDEIRLEKTNLGRIKYC